MFKSYLLLTCAALFPVIVAVIFYLFDTKTKFKNLNYKWKQIIIGVIFGLIAISGTHFGIPMSGAQVNVRDGAVITAGLCFGAPAGIIAGVLGGVERYVAVYFPTDSILHVGALTQIACSVSTIIAGLVSALLRKFVFKNKRAGMFAGLFTAFVIEIFHLFMVFVTNAADYINAIRVVKACTLPMAIANPIAVFLALFFLTLIEKGKKTFEKPDTKSMTARFTFVLAELTVVAFVLSSTFVFFFQSNMSDKQTNNLLENAINDTTNDVTDRVNNVVKEEATNISNIYGSELNNTTITADMQQFATDNSIYEINVIKSSGELVYSNIQANIDEQVNFFDSKYDDKGLEEFRAILRGEIDFYVQPFRKTNTMGSTTLLKYAGIKTEFGMLEIGYDDTKLNTIIGNEMQDIGVNKHVGETGFIIVMYKDLSLKSITKDVDFKYEDAEFQNILKNKEQGETYKLKINSETFFTRFYEGFDYYIISVLPQEEAQLMRDISIYMNTFLEIIVYGLLFATIYILITKLIIGRVNKTNESLDKITNGNLQELVEGGTTTEFIELANGINKTVQALENYIDAANKRIDEELAFAKAIQTAVLPSTFPAFPDRKEFDIHASMHTAKQVGGDFYDFYFSNSNMFHFTIADVSGKGIPAALFMMRSKQALKSLTQTNIPINEVFEKGNSALCEGNDAGMFVTAWTASVNLETGKLTYANGGHNPPLIKRKNGKFEYLRSIPNMVLAGMDGMPYKLNELQLEPGDIVYLYTDGVTEGVNEKTEQFGEARLEEVLNSKEFSSSKEICDTVFDAVTKFAGEADQFDDITMVAFIYKGK